MMLKIGITGGIGSGKSYVSKCFKHLGIPVYEADFEARRLTNEDDTLRKKIISLLGTEAYCNNELNRAFVASKVFNNETLLKQLNGIIHPAVEEDFKRWVLKNKQSPYVLKEAAILFESGSYKNLDKVIVVTATLDERISRVMKRDNTTKEEILKRINNQWPTDKIIELADFVIQNNNKTLILPQILKIDKTLRN